MHYYYYHLGRKYIKKRRCNFTLRLKSFRSHDHAAAMCVYDHH